jgi:UDP-glucose 4-epimerase
VTTLVVGRGLLGRALVARLRRDQRRVTTVAVPWGNPRAALAALHQAVRETAAAAGEAGWRLAWCAGAGVIATSAEALEQEVTLFKEFLDLPALPDACFLASSAGGAYGGSPDAPPFTERSRVGAAGPYGRAKLAMEDAVREVADRGGRVVVGRIANLYGPGQDLTKPQGLVSQLCLTQVTGNPLGVYASLDTLRDYLFAPDAAGMAAACLDRVVREAPRTLVVKILATGRPASIGSLVAESTRLSRHRPRISSGASAAPASDLRLQSEVWPEIDALPRTPLVVGLHATAADIAAQVRSGGLQQFMLRGS